LHEKRLDEEKYFTANEIEKYGERQETGKRFFGNISFCDL